MNIIIWNCRGALKPFFKKRVSELVQNYNPAILVVMETRVGKIELGRSQICCCLMEHSIPIPLAMQVVFGLCGMLIELI